LFLIPLLIFAVYQMFFETENRNKKYFKNNYLNFGGKVISKKIVSHGAGYVCLDLIYSNYKEYDPSDSLDNYYCIIENNKAVLTLSNIGIFEIGDLWKVNSKIDSCYLFDKNNKLKQQSTPFLVDWVAPPSSFDICHSSVGMSVSD
jgi:hypothetical protein